MIVGVAAFIDKEWQYSKVLIETLSEEEFRFLDFSPELFVISLNQIFLMFF